MSEFENYSEHLLYSSKVFLKEAMAVDASENDRQRKLRASIMLAFFFLEAQLNYLAAHFADSNDYEILERSLLSERDYTLQKGKFVLTEKSRFFRLEERIEFLLSRFSSEPEKEKGEWFSNLNSSIGVRNRLVHPKDAHKLEATDVERAILAVLGCLSALYKAIFQKEFPLAALGLHTRPTEC